VADDQTEVVDDGIEALGEPKLHLTVDVSKTGPCKKHVRVKISRNSLDEVESHVADRFAGEAQVPGFRVGHVPMALVKKRFRKELGDQVKQRVLMQSLEQLADENNLDPINEPNLDLEAIDIPEQGDFEYEFDVEVRPEFDLPNYKGLKIDRPNRETSDQDVTDYLNRYLEQYGQLTPIDEPAREGDYVTVNIDFTKGGEPFNSAKEVSLRVRPTLRFADGELAGFGKLITGAKAGDEREATVTISLESPVVELRGEKIQAKFHVLDVKRLETPELTQEFLDRLNVGSEDELKNHVRSTLERQVKYSQRQSCRSQVLGQITDSANWDLPEELVTKQVQNALRREVLEMQQAGFTSDEILSRQNELQQKSLTMTRRNLKEHFVLDRIATEENIEVTADDINNEIMLMALQSGENPRRVRSRLVKSGVIENLEAQIRERKAVDVILSHAQFKDVPMESTSRQDVYSTHASISPQAETRATEEEDGDGE
jgi:trigger factor